MKLFIIKNANVNIKDNKGLTPFKSLQIEGHKHLYYLINNIDSSNKCMDKKCDTKLNCNHEFCFCYLNKINNQLCPICRRSFAL